MVWRRFPIQNLLHGSVKPANPLALTQLGFAAIPARCFNIRGPRASIPRRFSLIHLRFEMGGLFDQDRSKLRVGG